MSKKNKMEDKYFDVNIPNGMPRLKALELLTELFENKDKPQGLLKVSAPPIGTNVEIRVKFYQADKTMEECSNYLLSCMSPKINQLNN
jgi:hypothetical protein